MATTFAALALVGCGSDGETDSDQRPLDVPSIAPPDPGEAQAIPNPQQAPSDPYYPPPNQSAPVPNPQQPTPAASGGAGLPAELSAQCTSFCAGVDGACSEFCAAVCRGVQQISATCASSAALALTCFAGNTRCRSDGTLTLPVNDCREELIRAGTSDQCLAELFSSRD